MKQIKKRWKQKFCKHHFLMIGQHTAVTENLWQCQKCEIYYIQHVGLGIGYKSKEIPFDGWRMFKK